MTKTFRLKIDELFATVVVFEEVINHVAKDYVWGGLSTEDFTNFSVDVMLVQSFIITSSEYTFEQNNKVGVST